MCFRPKEEKEVKMCFYLHNNENDHVTPITVALCAYQYVFGGVGGGGRGSPILYLVGAMISPKHAHARAAFRIPSLFILNVNMKTCRHVAVSQPVRLFIHFSVKSIMLGGVCGGGEYS